VKKFQKLAYRVTEMQNFRTFPKVKNSYSMLSSLLENLELAQLKMTMNPTFLISRFSRPKFQDTDENHSGLSTTLLVWSENNQRTHSGTILQKSVQNLKIFFLKF
jgi:hypothetical protein